MNFSWNLGPGSLAHGSILVPQVFKLFLMEKQDADESKMPFSWVFVRASLRSHDWLSHWPLADSTSNSSLCPLLSQGLGVFTLQPLGWSPWQPSLYPWEASKSYSINIIGHHLTFMALKHFQELLRPNISEKHIFGHLNEQIYISYNSLFLKWYLKVFY